MTVERTAIVSLDGVSKSIGSRAVIRKTSIELAAGARLAFIRPSGVRRRERVRELAKLVRLPESLLHRWPSQISGGTQEKQPPAGSKDRLSL